MILSAEFRDDLEIYWLKLYLISISEAAKISEKFCFTEFPKRYSHFETFYFEKDRLLSAGAGFLLAKVIQCKENDIRINEYGKPYLDSDVQFNISHSGQYTVLAVSDCNVGVDIECISDKNLGISDVVFTEDEKAWINVDPIKRFFILWTAKESILKLFGTGLSVDMKSFSSLKLFNEDFAVIGCRTIYYKSFIIDNHALTVACEQPIESPEVYIVKENDFNSIDLDEF